jgi:hypothetical protein
MCLFLLSDGSIRVIDQLNGDKDLIKGAHTGRIIDLRLHPSSMPSPASAIAVETEKSQREAACTTSLILPFLFYSLSHVRIDSVHFDPSAAPLHSTPAPDALPLLASVGSDGVARVWRLLDKGQPACPAGALTYLFCLLSSSSSRSHFFVLLSGTKQCAPSPALRVRTRPFAGARLARR